MLDQEISHNVGRDGSHESYSQSKQDDRSHLERLFPGSMLVSLDDGNSITREPSQNSHRERQKGQQVRRWLNRPQSITDPVNCIDHNPFRSQMTHVDID